MRIAAHMLVYHWWEYLCVTLRCGHGELVLSKPDGLVRALPSLCSCVWAIWSLGTGIYHFFVCVKDWYLSEKRTRNESTLRPCLDFHFNT
jgi:hypothetical protein